MRIIRPVVLLIVLALAWIDAFKLMDKVHPFEQTRYAIRYEARCDNVASKFMHDQGVIMTHARMLVMFNAIKECQQKNIDYMKMFPANGAGGFSGHLPDVMRSGNNHGNEGCPYWRCK